jgi:2-polyprenyl-3-methyl-5-hydroxy-6-metoxy-1,4-benzoquinol methylase
VNPENIQLFNARANRVAALANAAVYDSTAARTYIGGAPHIKHSMLRRLYGQLVVAVYDCAARYASSPNVLDLGAGDGSAIVPFLELGATVTAIDISESRLKQLKRRCAGYGGRFQVRCEDVFDGIDSIRTQGRRYEIVVANSFLHHVPDYLGLIRRTVGILSPHGQFLSFQDPLRYDSLGQFASLFRKVAYYSWRITQGDLAAGLRRHIRRRRGMWLDDCAEDNAEYHAVRGGVDGDAIYQLCGELGLECEIIRYFSTQSSMWQAIGHRLGVENTFALIARRGV